MLTVLALLAALALLAPGIWSIVTCIRSKEGVSPALRRRCIVTVGGGLLAVLLGYAGVKASGYYTEYLWFQNLGYGEVYTTQLFTRLALFVGVGLVTAGLAFWITGIPFRSAQKLSGAENSREAEEWQGSIPLMKAIRILAVVVAALVVGGVAQSSWDTVLLHIYGVEHGEVDPVFGKDISFYLFDYPFYELLSKTLFRTVFLFLALAGIGTAVLAMRTRDMNSEADAWGYLRRTVRALSPVFILLALAEVFRTWVAQYGLLYSPEGKVVGIGYTDLHAWLPAYRVYMCGLAALIVSLIAYWTVSRKIVGLVTGGLAVLVVPVMWIIGFAIVPLCMHQFVVKPSEYDREREFLEFSIAGTRAGFGIDDAEERTYVPRMDLSYQDLQQSKETLEAVRLADWRALAQTYEQYQEFRTYYRFPDVDIDRYMVNGNYRQLMVGSRELNVDDLPEDSQTWNNRHLVYTHGYGVVASVSSDFTNDGMPRLYIKDIPTASEIAEIQVTRPEIYYGELTHQHVYVNSGMKEFSYPHGEENVYVHYEGQGGVPVGGFLRKLALAWRFDGARVMLSDYIKPETRVMWHREIHERVSTIAPFLRLDDDEYKVISDGGLHYIQDCYTTSRYYPYSAQYGDCNYIRNSVKATVDAYNGTVDFWLFDEKDPVARTWARIFPDLFKSKAEMPATLREHVRYPEDLLALQAQVYGTYHMDDPYVFYGREDRWDTAKEVYRDEEQTVEPYSVIIKLPGEESEEFLLMIPCTPIGKNNMIGWFAGRSDGEHYGKLLIYQMPKDRLTFGPLQMEAKINQHPEMKRDLGLWATKGTQVIRGNLLVLPLQGGLLYVEPIYLQSENAPMPELARVVVGMGEQVEWGKTFDEALRKLFGLAVEDRPGVVIGPLPEGEAAELIESVQTELDRYITLWGEGRFEEAAQAFNKALETLRNAKPANDGSDNR